MIETELQPSVSVSARPPRRRVTSRSERLSVAFQAILVLGLLGVLCFFMAQDLEAPIPEALAAAWLGLAVFRVVACWKFGFVFSEDGVVISGSIMRHSLSWSDVMAISEAQVQRRNLASLMLSGSGAIWVLRVHRRTWWSIRVRATRGIGESDLAALRVITVRHGARWRVAPDFAARSRVPSFLASSRSDT